MAIASATQEHERSLENEVNPREAQAARFDRAAELLHLDQGLCKVLRNPQREVTVNFPVQMDDGQIEVFTGYRVQHSTARGPGKGGIRYAPQQSLRRRQGWRHL
jgi:glutamate dehydrogenase (NAD(P)+)